MNSYSSRLYGWLGLLIICGVLLIACGGSNGRSQAHATSSPSAGANTPTVAATATSVPTQGHTPVPTDTPVPTNTPVPTPPTPTPTPLVTPSPTPPAPLASVSISNIDAIYEIPGSQLCFVTAYVQNVSGVVAYDIKVHAELTAAPGVSGFQNSSVDLIGQTDLFPGQNLKYQGQIVYVISGPFSAIVTASQNGQQIGQGQTSVYIGCH